MSVHGQTLDWSYDYSVAESSMAIGVSESSIDQLTVQGNTFPIGGAMGAFYLNEDNDVLFNTDTPIAGFQFDVGGASSVLSASGGLATFNSLAFN